MKFLNILCHIERKIVKFMNGLIRTNLKWWKIKIKQQSLVASSVSQRIELVNFSSYKKQFCKEDKWRNGTFQATWTFRASDGFVTCWWWTDARKSSTKKIINLFGSFKWSDRSIIESFPPASRNDSPRPVNDIVSTRAREMERWICCRMYFPTRQT